MATNALKCWANNLGLVDIWRLINPTIRDYKFFSGAAALLPIALLGHKGVLCSATLDYISKRAATLRFNSNPIIKV